MLLFHCMNIYATETITMKIGKQIIITTSLVLLLASCNQQRDAANNADTDKPITASLNATKEKQAKIYYEKLMEYYGDDWMERESDPELYPDYYCGSYIDDSGNFVVAINGNVEEIRPQLIHILGGNDFIIERASYSYKQMMRVMDRIDAFLVDESLTEDHPVIYHFGGAYPDVLENRVKVILTETSSEITGRFRREISNSPMIVFEKGEIPQLN